MDNNRELATRMGFDQMYFYASDIGEYNINKEVDVIGIIANKIEVDEIDYIQKELQKSFPKNLQIDIIPKIDFLSYPTVREVVKALNGSVLFGKQFLNKFFPTT